MYLNWYYFKGGLVQSTLLAGPGVLIGAALMGTFTRLLLGWPWNLSMLFGSILSATDTVAMVALLKSVGASPKLTILIVGESLLNDGSAMVLFTIFYNSVNGTLYTPSSIALYVSKTVLGSLGLGVGVGLLALRWLRSANRPLVESDTLVQIAVTVCTAYLTFFLAQNTLALSGILACVSAGTVLAWLAPAVILNHESMHTIWGMIEWSLNTVIFLLAGLIIGHRILSKVQAIDWLYAVVFYLVLNLVRGITIGSLFPFISSIGHRCTVKEGIFMSWAGLRGALGMALALIVENNCPADIHDQTSRLFFYVGCIASLTLLINATTAKHVLISLGLVVTDSPEKALVTTQIKRKLQRKTDRFIGELTNEFSLTPADIDEVRMSCTILQELDIAALMRPTDLESPGRGQSRSMASVVSESEEDASSLYSFDHTGRMHSALSHYAGGAGAAGGKSLRGISKHLTSSLIQAKHISQLLSAQRGPHAAVMPELLQYVRAIFLEIVKVKYWHFIDIGKLPRLSFSAQFLLYSIEMGLDKSTEASADWNCLEEEFAFVPYGMRMLYWYQNTCPSCLTKKSSKMLAFMEARQEKRQYYMLSAFIEAHEHAEKKIHSFLGLTEDAAADEDGKTKTGTVPCPEEAVVIEESRKAVASAKAMVLLMNAETLGAIKAKQVARVVLAKQAELVQQMVREGLLTPSYAEDFLEEISQDTQRIEKERNRMYKMHTRKRAKELQAELEERDSGTRFSFFSMIPFSGRNSSVGERDSMINDAREGEPLSCLCLC